ncbi:MAG: SMEK domain-containing protein [Sulfuritalea sp.]|nr:SMEK domain-containing protein [Sulfuritalea sp.]
MKQLDLLNEFREQVAQLRYQVEAASAMGHYDTHKVAENVMCGLLRELCDWPSLRNLNPEQTNFPGIDLADDNARIAVQVTATADIAKVKHTLEKFVSHGLEKRYDRLIIYVLSTKQGSYSQSAIDVASGGKFQLSNSEDIWDYQELCSKAADASPQKLQAALNHLKAYLRGVPVGLADEDIDPPMSPSESLTANLVDVDFPGELYIAQLNNDLVARHSNRRPGRWRETIREFNRELGTPVPSAYVVHSGALITFFDLTYSHTPYKHLVERGTEEALGSQDFWKIDEDHERVFKSLLRFSLQQRLFQEQVRWENDDRQFIFLPRPSSPNQREEVWQGDKKSKRTVFMRQFNKKDPSKVFLQKHLSFSVEFNRLGDQWLMSITPSWFFSYGEDFKKSGYGYENLSWIKRQENNQAVLNHFRFVATWLRSIDGEDLFSEGVAKDSFLSFGDILFLDGAPSLDESKWTALPEALPDESGPNLPRLFGR